MWGGFEFGDINTNYITNVTNYINYVTTKPTAAVASGHECPTLLFVVHLVDWCSVHHI